MNKSRNVFTSDTVTAETKEVKAAPKQAPAKAKPPAKAPAKPLPQMMEEDVIPSLKAILESQDDISEIELSFQDNRVSFTLFERLNPCPKLPKFVFIVLF
jgi:hypothetical protein